MTRRKKCLLYGLILLFLGFAFMRVTNFFFTMDALYTANERGQRYGPSDEIVATWEEDGKTIMVGKWQDSLFLAQGEKVLGLLWRNAEVGQILGWGTKLNVVFGFTEETVYGLSRQEDIATVYVRVVYMVEEEASEFYKTKDVTIPVSDDGFFITQVDQRSQGPHLTFAQYVEGYNAEGDVVYTYGQIVDVDYYNGIEKDAIK